MQKMWTNRTLPLQVSEQTHFVLLLMRKKGHNVQKLSVPEHEELEHSSLQSNQEPTKSTISFSICSRIVQVLDNTREGSICKTVWVIDAASRNNMTKTYTNKITVYAENIP